MQITTEEHGDSLELRVEGRLDNEWAEQLTAALNEHVRQGSHTVVLDLTEVSYLSSAGIGALIRAHKQFQSIRGFFGVGLASPQVTEVIRMTGLSQMLMCDIEKARRASGALLANTSLASLSGVSVKSGIYFDSYTVNPNAQLACEVLGDPDRFPRDTFMESTCQRRDFPAQTFGLGLGAFGRSFADCEDRFGEFVAVSGAAAYLPTSKAGKPDYQVAQGNFIPQVHVAYGLQCRGEFRQLQRFESGTDDSRIPFSTLVDECLTMSDTDLAGMVVVAETSGLIGAALKRSPAIKADSTESKLSHPEVRRWLSFSPEQAFARSMAVVVGIASRGDPLQRNSRNQLPSLLRPLRPANDLFGHFHAAVFSYRPFKKRKLDLNATVSALFETEDLQTVLHLLNDDRAITGSGESEFTRGACWVGPISTVTGGTPR
jgi:anti-anti-sigma factor